MGHERVGYLPKTKKWSSIIEDISAYTGVDNKSGEIASQTLQNVRSQFEKVIQDSGTNSAFEFLILLSLIPRNNNWQVVLADNGVSIDDNFSLLQIVSSAKAYIKVHENSAEYSTIATQALIDSIVSWTSTVKQGNLFISNISQSEIWHNASTGAGFCELSRLFFSKFTERYLKYFLHREAYGRITNLYELGEFNRHLEKHVQSISTHAFETAKITQSYSAGWYNKHVKDIVPSERVIKKFVNYSFRKLNSELLNQRISG